MIEGRPVKLTQKEFALLQYLMEHKNMVAAREELFKNTTVDRE